MTPDNKKALLVVGPLPPPINGTGVSFQLFCDEVRKQTGLPKLEIIDSSPRKLKEKSSVTSMSNYAQMWRIFSRFCRKISSVDGVIIFGSEGFLLLMVPLLLIVAKIARKPCYIRAFGGSLDHFYENLQPLSRWILLFTLRRADGLIVQTNWLYERFRSLIGEHVFLVQGYRPLSQNGLEPQKRLGSSEFGLHLIFLGIVKEAKGVFILLESLRRLHAAGHRSIQCDFFGLISTSSAQRFREELAKTPNATYGGVLNPEEVITTLQSYDALVFPTFYDGEGHPGVLIEAMMAGIPVITTAFRSIPELVDHEVNGLLVTPEDATSLVEAITTLAQNRRLAAEMGKRNWERRHNYDARQVVPLILQPLGVDTQPPSASLLEAY